MTKSKLSSRAWGTRLVAVLCCGLMSSFTAAQDLPDPRGTCAPEVTVNRRARIEHEGASGWWFHDDVARCMLGRLETLPLYYETVRLGDQRREAEQTRFQLLTEALELSRDIETRLEAAVSAATQRASSAENELRALWIAVAVLGALAVGVVGGLAVAVSLD